MRTTLIVLSYNRPRMLAEALASVGDQADELILVDDGSDALDPAAVARAHGALLIAAPPVPAPIRARTPRLGRLLNAAIHAASGEAVGYLCDDDLFAPGWLRAAAAFLEANPSTSLVRGTWLQFHDGHAPGDDPCPLDERQMTAGNFVHRRGIAAAWSETALTSHDNTFLHSAHRGGVDTFAAPHCGALAGWRRLHAKNLIHVSASNQLTADAAAFIAGRME